MLLFGKYLRYQMLVLTDRGIEAAKEHQMMYEAALNRDADTASRYLEDHIYNGLMHALDAMQQ